MNCNDSTCYLAVYGTLKRGGFYNHIIAGRGRYIDTRRNSGWRMYDNFGKYPYAVRGSADEMIVVELWQIPAEILPKVDALEDYPGYYQRTKLELEIAGGEIVSAYFYYVSKDKVEGLPQIDSGDWQV